MGSERTDMLVVYGELDFFPIVIYLLDSNPEMAALWIPADDNPAACVVLEVAERLSSLEYVEENSLLGLCYVGKRLGNCQGVRLHRELQEMEVHLVREKNEEKKSMQKEEWSKAIEKGGMGIGLMACPAVQRPWNSVRAHQACYQFSYDSAGLKLGSMVERTNSKRSGEADIRISSSGHRSSHNHLRQLFIDSMDSNEADDEETEHWG